MNKNIIAILVTFSTLFSACGDSLPKMKDGQATKDSVTAKLADKSEIKDEELYPFMLGGIYFFNGYGGAPRTFDVVIKSAMKAAPGSPEFLKELQAAYHQFFVFPFKPEEDLGGKEAKKTFNEWWGVKSKPELESLLTWLLNEGHQAEFLKYKSIIDAHGGPSADLSKLNFDTYGLDDKNRDTKVTMTFVQQNYSAFSPAGIRAWDIARYVNNICIAYQAQYFTREEAMMWLNKAVPVAREHYDSWIAYYNDFTLGRKFWNGGTDDQPIITETAVAMLRGNYSIYTYLAFK